MMNRISALMVIACAVILFSSGDFNGYYVGFDTMTLYLGKMILTSANWNVA
jgi:uncharacterized protein YigA (DUF484 family)